MTTKIFKPSKADILNAAVLRARERLAADAVAAQEYVRELGREHDAALDQYNRCAKDHMRSKTNLDGLAKKINKILAANGVKEKCRISENVHDTFYGQVTLSVSVSIETGLSKPVVNAVPEVAESLTKLHEAKQKLDAAKGALKELYDKQQWFYRNGDQIRVIADKLDDVDGFAVLVNKVKSITLD